MMERELPEGWVDVQLGEVTTKPQYGWTSKAGPTGSVKYLRTTDLSRGKVNWDTVPYCDLVPDDVEKYQLYENDIVISRAGSVGLSFRIDTVPDNIVFASYLIRFRAITIEPKILEYYLKSPAYWSSISEVSAGIAVQNINAVKISELRVPLPPLAEQKRIVAKLDEAFQHLDTLKARLERIPELLKNFRQAVLTQAVTGKLTEGVVSTLPKTVGNTKCELPNYWRVVDFAELIETGPQNGLYKPQTAYGSGKMILRIDNFYSGKVNPWETLRRLELSDDELHTYSLANDDLVVNRVNSIQYLGKSALIRSLEEDCVFESNVMRIKLQHSTSYPEYISLYLNSFIGLAELRKNAKHAVNQASINQQDVKAVQIILPPLEEQKEIVRRVEALFAKADAIEGYYATLKEKIDKLPQAVLAKAFRGELVPQDPNDEPASVLLEKIKAAKAATVKPGKGKKAKGGKQGELVL